jgi:large subunit ribosomal protein L10
MPSAAVMAEKAETVAELTQHFESSDAALITEYRGLKVAELARLRRSAKADGGTYHVYKNTLARIGAKNAGIEDLDPLLVGPVGIMFVQGDIASVAKSLRDFGRTAPALVVKGGVIGRQVLSAKQVEALADLPSREVLLAQFAGALQAPMAQLAGLLQALPRDFAYGLKALVDQRSEA